MKIILIQNVLNLGKEGEIKEVAEGYARNFLLPKKMAEIATPEKIKETGERKKREEQKEKEDALKIKALAEKLNGVKIEMKKKAKKGKLFGSIGKEEIKKELQAKGFDIKEKNIILKENIREVGEREVEIQFTGETKAKVVIKITEE